LMSSQLATVLRWLALLAVGATLATACVRSEPPSVFTCATDTDCGETEKCRDARCMDERACRNEYDCDSGALQVCRQNECVTVECTPFYVYKCAPGYRCNGEVCFTSCSADSACSSGFHCDGGQCVPGERPRSNDETCATDAQCRSGTCCARASGKVCSDRCEPLGASCATAQDCQDSYCCEQTAAGLLCSSTPCTTLTCAFDEACEDDEFCTALGHCVDKLANAAACKANRECASDLCASGVCQPTVGSPCETAAGCGPQQQCCIVEPGARRGCAVSTATCLAEAGQPCEFDFECAEENCQNQLFCSKPCSTHDDCGVGPSGEPNACVQTFLGSKICYPGCKSTAQCESAFPFYESICATVDGLGYCDLY
jgi:hypothetical protein